MWRAETASGTYFAKQNTPPQAFEARLLSLLGELAPDYVVPVVAADLDRDLLLTPDQGTVLGDTLADASEDDLLPVIRRMLGEAAQLQREVAPHAERLADAGLERLAPADVLPYVQQRLDEFSSLPVGDPRSFETGAPISSRRSLPSIAAAVDQVSALGLPLTLHHNDLHTFNVFEVDGRMRFFDFGDAMLSEPLGRAHGAARRGRPAPRADRRRPTDPRARRRRTRGLERPVAPLSELRAALPAALRLARLAAASPGSAASRA